MGGCDCEQAKSPVGRAVLFTLAAIGIAGLLSDSLKLGWNKLSGKKPPKHVLSKKGFRLEDKISTTHLCDMCGKRGTQYSCTGGSPYDMCKVCYKNAKKKVKAELDAWYDKHPEEKKKEEEKKKDKKQKGDKDDGSDDDGKKSETDDGKKSETDKSEGAGEKTESSKGDKDEDQSEPETKES